ncbi:MAG: hypothetical protein FE039_03135 [Thermoplasmata archaeon]|nr:MAG: hypothetical protein FE039_03135 [Thermoplasmata archaeon]
MYISLIKGKRILCIYVILSLVSSSLTPLFLVVKADGHSPVWIDENKDGDFDDGEWNGTSIQRAIENATKGDIIYVGNGTYVEAITVNKEVTIRSEYGYENTIIRSISGEEENDLGAITINSDNVTIENLTVTNGSIGIYIYNATNVTIDGCNISLNLDGIRVYNSSDCSITNCHSHNNSGHGVRLCRSYNCRVLNCIFGYNEDNEITLNTTKHSLIENKYRVYQ